MKNNTLVLLASFAALATWAGATQSATETNAVVLPAYVVEAPRYLPIERHINASLNELRQQAHAPIVVAPEFTALRAQVDRNAGPAATTQNAKRVRIARL